MALHLLSSRRSKSSACADFSRISSCATPEAPVSRTLHTHRDTGRSSFPGQQPLEQPLVFDVGFAHCAQQFRAAFHSFCAQVFPHTRGEEALARFIEANSRALFDHHANLAQLVFVQSVQLSLAFAHRAPVFWASFLLPPPGEEERRCLTKSAGRDGPLGIFTRCCRFG